MNSTQYAPSSRPRRKNDLEEYDLVILGGCTGSTIAAWMFAEEGKRVIAIDHKYIGGFPKRIEKLEPHFVPGGSDR